MQGYDATLMPESITVYIKDGEKTVDTLTVKAGKDNKWTFTSRDLPKYRADGKTEIAYSVDEKVPDGFSKVVTGNNIKNTYVPELTKVSGEKVWDLKGNNELLPEEITVYIKDGTTTVDTLTVKAGEDGKWSFTSKDLPKYRADGTTEIVYTVDEAEVPGFDKVISGTRITNTLKTTQVTVEKIWDDDDNKSNTRPEKVMVQLQADGNNLGAAVELNEENGWKYTWNDLVKLDNNNEIVYTVTEAQVPGYKKPVITKVSENAWAYTITNSVTHVEVKKTDIANGKEVAGAKLVVLDKDDKEFDSWTSTENGNHIIEGLKTGEENVYTLRETVAPEGYTVVTDIKFWVDETGKVTVVGARTVDENGKTVILVEDAKTHVEVKKTDIANGKEVAGAKLVVLDKDDKEFDSWTSTENGNHIIEGLKTGSDNVYTLRETVAPEGYTVVTDIKFWVDETGKVTVVGARTVDENGKTVILVEDAKTHVEVKKTDIANGKEVEGAKLVVLDKDDKEFDSWTSTENGNHIIEGLKTGEENVYTLRETVAPEGYTVVTDIKFWVDETGKVTVVGARTVDENGKTVILVEDAKTHVEVKKTDIANGKEVEGAKLVVLDKDDKEFDSWTSTENGNHIIEGLKTGEENVYTLRETVAPEGYTVVTDIKFWVDETGKVTVVGARTVDENGKTVILVEDAKTHVEVKKTDIANGKEVEGAKLVVLDKDDKEFDSWTSTENGNHIIEGLKTGEENVYTLRETVAPEGYTVVTDIKFWVDETGKVTVVGARTVDENGKTVILVEDAKTHVEVKKTDIANGKEVAGAKLVVLDKDDKEFDSWTSTENGNHIIEGLKTGEENVYTLRETVAPEGYTVVTDIKFWVDETGKVTVVGARTVDENGKTVILVEDAKTHVEVKKTDIANGKEVEGAKLVVLDKDDKEFDSWTSTENGNHIIEGLKTGEENVYTLRETVAPEGYTVVRHQVLGGRNR
ncbi:SpaA isopeptide-forming pilin-related protein [Aristaeella lactis]|uniref:SpaA isopeptide-forming pilin-related protein n=1 Tax=Aristaeella lactis TaxID=3046383 RepID=UPI001BB7DF20|nr:Cna B-type domain-containing protein [Aristaeella lactis]